MSKVQKRAAIRLATEFLKSLAERLGNDGCNDWEWPEWVPVGLRKEIVKVDGYGKECPGRCPPNFVAVYGLIAVLEKITPGVE